MYKEKNKIKKIKNTNNSKIYKQKLIHSADLKSLPDDISISTMTIVCKIDTKINITNIDKYADLSYSGLLRVGDRSLIPKKIKSNKKNKKLKKDFFNQLPVAIKPRKNNAINIKLFINGSIQMTGCKSIQNAIEVLEKLFVNLGIEKAVMDVKNNKFVDKPFVESTKNLSLQYVKDFRIVMINSNFDIKFRVDRDKLLVKLLRENYEAKYDPIMHAGVIIKHKHTKDNKKISIFVFESGCIIITGAKNCEHILSAYNFINKYLLSNYTDVVKNDLLSNSTILKYLNKE